MPGAEEKVCQRQTRKEKNVVEIDRKAEAGDTQARKESSGSVKGSSPLQCCWGCMNEIWTFRGKEAGEHAGAGSPGNSVWRGSVMRAQLTASL